MDGEHQPRTQAKYPHKKILVGAIVHGQDSEMMDVAADLQVEDQHEDEAGQQFDPEIAHRKGGATGTAAAAQQPVAEQRDVVAHADGLVTLTAARSRTDQAAALWQTDDADIEETA